MPSRAVQRDFTDSDSDSAVYPFAEQPEKESNLPTPVGLNDEEEPSPSQYRAEECTRKPLIYWKKKRKVPVI
jgi:hypothetical protein